MSQHLSPYLRKQCQEVMEKICSRPTAQFFFYPIDPIQDNCPDYFEIVKFPMDLSTIKKNLRNNKYKSVAEWKRDMELVWSNSLLYNSDDATLGIMTRDLQEYYMGLTKYLSDSYRSAWKYKLIDLQQEFNTYLRELQKCKGIYQNQKVRSISKRDQLHPMLEELPPPQFRRHFQFLKKEEIEQLLRDINSLKEEYELNSIKEILKENEPTVVNDENGHFIPINLNALQPTTLALIQNQINEMRGT